MKISESEVRKIEDPIPKINMQVKVRPKTRKLSVTKGNATVRADQKGKVEEEKGAIVIRE